jgi:alanyl-tRNA synthetase
MAKEYDLAFFHDHGYHRKKCSSCGDYFWTLNPDQQLCGDKPCVDYSFIGTPLAKRPLSLTDVRNAFLSYFEAHGHSRLNYPVTGPRCPVIARWRSDIYLTIASIADFQPHVTSGVVPPPANPLVISQPCIRLNDLDEVGKSGRHLTLFEMMGHHAFNKHTDEIYWKEATVAYCDEFFRTRIGIPGDSITYKEQLWIGGGNAGPCVEVLAQGLEIATLVFMNMKEDPHGPTVLEGKNYAPNPLNIVDTGYGLERIAWFTTGTPTVYETVFPVVLDYIQDYTTNQDMPSIYSLADHSKCLAFMLGDGIVPSNVKAGYLARLIIRRSLRFLEKLNINIPLREIVDLQLTLLKKDFPSLIENQKQIDEILDIETDRFTDTRAKGESLVRRIVNEKKTIDTADLVLLYDTHGMAPDIVQTIAKTEGITLDIPENFDSMIADLHSHEKPEEAVEEQHLNLPQTIPLYYQDSYIKEFDATILWTQPTPTGAQVILDKTAFYPDGGGQPGDHGTFIYQGKEIPVIDVVKHGDAIIHNIGGIIPVGQHIHGRIDWTRRYTLMKHHTGTHVVNAALRSLLGNQIWQAGSQLGLTDARFDFSHYKALDDDTIRAVERKANQYVAQAVTTWRGVMERNEAERRFGFRLYQGGVPPGDCIRVLNIPGIDSEACGGTHLNNIKEIDHIRILKVERIQDGVNRLIFAAGEVADQHQQAEETLFHKLEQLLAQRYTIKDHANIPQQLKDTTRIFSVPTETLEKTLQRFASETPDETTTPVSTLPEAAEHLFTQWKATQKQKHMASSDEIERLKQSAMALPGTPYHLIAGTCSGDALAIAAVLTKEPGIILHISDGTKITSASSEDVTVDLRSIAPEIGKLLGGSGGGKPHLTQAGGPHRQKLEEALSLAVRLTKEQAQKKEK